jgi:hypothetical protein
MNRPQRPPLMKGGSTAPFIYFDSTPSCGVHPGGIVEIELAGRVIVPQANGEATPDVVCVAHLR